MLGPEIRCVVGIDVAKPAPVVCALEVPSGAMRHKPSRIEATAAGYALLRSWLHTWAEGGPAETVLIGLEATGSLWEPLYDTLTQAAAAQSAADRVVGVQPGATRQDRWD